MNNTTFYLVRHRESTKNALGIHHSRGINDFPLTLNGYQQSSQLVQLFRDQAMSGIDVMFTSPFLRCRETIAPLEKDRNITAMIDDRITECDVGNLDRTLWEKSKYITDHLTDEPLGDIGESLLACQQRVWDFMKEIQEKYAGKAILICSHGEPLLFAKQYFLGFDYDNKTECMIHYPAKDGYDECIVDTSGKLISHRSYGSAQI